ncbi:hypothetical protein pb186bvf_000738 [Paramecium bursaria]
MISSNGNGYHEQGVAFKAGRSGGNYITIRGAECPEFLPSVKKSQNITQAHFKTLRFYRKICRMLPFILRIMDFNNVVSQNQAMLNVANIFRQKAYIRDPSLVDWNITKGYEILQQAEWHYLNRDHLYQYLCNTNVADSGYSYLEEKKMKGKSSFLKDFIVGKQSHEY